MRGLDRLTVLPSIIYRVVFNLQERTDELCGEAGGRELCFSACPTPGNDVARDLSQFSCYFYNNGNPDDPEMTPSEVETLWEPLRVDPTLQTTETDTRCCGQAVGSERMEGNTYCMQSCADFTIRPGMSGPHPPPCVYVYRGSELEILLSRLSLPLERVVENEKLFCQAKNLIWLPDGGVECEDEAYARLCRTDRQGVIQLPPGSSFCMIYINGPAASVGLLAASGLAAQLMGGFTAVTAGGAAATAGSLLASNECTAPFCVARSGQCCLLAMNRRGLVCPLSC